jgi:DNA-binding NarL/FixJ family response regulator
MRVLVIDDDTSLRGLVASLLREISHATVTFATLDEVVGIAGSRARRTAADVVVLDVDAARVQAAIRQVACAFPRTAVYTIVDGDYERSLTAAFAGAAACPARKSASRFGEMRTR